MNTEYILHYYQKWQRGELAMSQIAAQLGVSEERLAEEFNKLSGTGTKQTLNG